MTDEWSMELTRDDVDKLVQSMFPDRLPLDVLLQRCVTRAPGPDWKRIPAKFIRYATERPNLVPCFHIICEQCLPSVSDWLPDDPPMLTTDRLIRSVDVNRHFCSETGASEDVSFWLPVTVWLGICDRCGTVYWDRD